MNAFKSQGSRGLNRPGLTDQIESDEYGAEARAGYGTMRTSRELSAQSRLSRLTSSPTPVSPTGGKTAGATARHFLLIRLTQHTPTGSV
jgi:hypothetical protein